MQVSKRDGTRYPERYVFPAGMQHVCTRLQILSKTASLLLFYADKKYSARRTYLQRHIRPSITQNGSENFSSGISGKLPKIALQTPFSRERLIVSPRNFARQLRRSSPMTYFITVFILLAFKNKITIPRYRVTLCVTFHIWSRTTSGVQSSYLPASLTVSREFCCECFQPSGKCVLLLCNWVHFWVQWSVYVNYSIDYGTRLFVLQWRCISLHFYLKEHCSSRMDTTSLIAVVLSSPGHSTPNQLAHWRFKSGDRMALPIAMWDRMSSPYQVSMCLYGMIL